MKRRFWETISKVCPGCGGWVPGAVKLAARFQPVTNGDGRGRENLVFIAPQLFSFLPKVKNPSRAKKEETELKKMADNCLIDFSDQIT